MVKNVFVTDKMLSASHFTVFEYYVSYYIKNSHACNAVWFLVGENATWKAWSKQNKGMEKDVKSKNASKGTENTWSVKIPLQKVDSVLRHFKVTSYSL
jgi:hypothetical protein